MANWFAYVFGDDSVEVSVSSGGTVTSAPIDASIVNIATSTLKVMPTTTTAGDVSVESSHDGVNNWVETYSTTYSGTDLSINGSTALNGFASFFRVKYTDTSATAGTIGATFEGQS